MAILTKKQHIKETLRIALPMIAASLGHVSVQLADTAIVGHLGTTELAAMTFANSVFVIGMVFGLAFTAGVTPLIGKANGQQNPDDIAVWLKHSFVGNSIMTCAIILVMATIGQFMPYMGQEPAVVEKAIPLYYFFAASFIPLMTFSSAKQFLEGMARTRPAMYITIAMNILNVILSYSFVYGELGFPRMGLLGAGLGTLLARIFSGSVFWIFIHRHPELQLFVAKAREISFSREKLARLFHISLPIAGQSIVEVGAFAIGAVMMGWISKEAQAGHQIAISLAFMTFMVSMGIGNATTVRVSTFLGEGNHVEKKRAAVTSFQFVFVLASFFALGFLLFRDILPTFYNSDPVVLDIAAHLLIVAAIFQLFDAQQVVALSALRGLTDVRIPTVITVIAYVLVSLPVSYLGYKLGYHELGIWVGFVSGLGVAAVVLTIRFFRITRTV